ncbi:uncharacterized protein LOC108606208 [Drosophila busckii]|uniref:uncharacterized protein LOC108606208 n=1 Tax=Drosophila busckii TaxID=30019 RepID=UPI00083EBAE8|nr:uncharacterized protein LOC108606208 [Drosophila busckii]
MQTLRKLSRCMREQRLIKHQKLLLTQPYRLTSWSRLSKSILADVDEQEELEHEEEHLRYAGYPILGNRFANLFYMPQSVGPAYQDLVTTTDQFDLCKYHESIDWKRIKPINAQVVRCPKLLLPDLKEIFDIPCHKFKEPSKFSIFNLYFDTELNSAIKSFVLIASRYSMEFMQDGYWADFVNPFTGRAYFRPAADRKLINESRLLGHNMIFKSNNGCTSIEEARKCKFAGAIFTDVPISFFE